MLIPDRDTLERLYHRIFYRDHRIAGFLVIAIFHAFAICPETIRKNICSRISVHAETHALFLGHKREIPSDPLRLRIRGKKAALFRPVFHMSQHVIFRLLGDNGIFRHPESRHFPDRDIGIDLPFRSQISSDQFIHIA